MAGAGGGVEVSQVEQVKQGPPAPPPAPPRLTKYMNTPEPSPAGSDGARGRASERGGQQGSRDRGP